jgi:MYXO-CTERM domain-containing protein
MQPMRCDDTAAHTLPRLLCALCCIGLLAGARSPAMAEPPPQCEAYAAPVVAASLRAPALREASGLALSRSQPGVLWTHNDSGDGAFVFAFSLTGDLLGTWQVTGAVASDWEDIAIGPCAGALPSDPPRCLYIADTGDNAHARADLAMYRVPEPVVDPSAAPTTSQTLLAERLPIRYPDAAHDCEAFMVHPSGALFWVTKALSGDSFIFYWPSFDAPLPAGGIATLEPLGTHSFGRVPIFQQAATGADFAPDGLSFAVRSYQRAHVFSTTTEGSPSDQVRDAFLRSDALIFTIPNEDQGEAIAFDPSSGALWTTSEGDNPPLQRFDCARWATPTVEDDVTSPPEDVTSPPEDVTSPPEDVTSPPLDTAPPSPDASLDPESTSPAGCRCSMTSTPTSPSALLMLLMLLCFLASAAHRLLILVHRPRT